MSLEITESALPLPEDWKLENLGDVSNINMGQSPSSSAYNDLGNGKYLIQGNADIKNRKTAPRIWTTEFPKVCQEGDVLMTVRAPVGAIARSLHNACLGRGVCAITSDVVDNEYLYQYLLSYETRWAAIEQGSTFTAVNGKDIRGIEIPLPPLAEQQKIADILSTVDKKMAVMDEQLAQTQELKWGLMQRLLTRGIGHATFKDSPLGQIPESWEATEVQHVLTVHNTLRKPLSAEVRSSMKGEYRYYGPTGVLDYINEFMLDGKYVLIGEDGDHFLKYKMKKMTLLVKGKFNVNNHAHILSGNEKCLTEWFYLFYQHRDLDAYLTRQGAGRYKLTKAALQRLPIAVPSISEQEVIIELCSCIDDKLQVLTDKKTQYQELKRGLMQQLLTGQRRVRTQAPITA